MWRMVWVTTPDGKYRIVVGQEWEYREDLARDIVLSQLTPWLIASPVILLMLVWLVSRALAPLHKLARQLRSRKPDDASELPTQTCRKKCVLWSWHLINYLPAPGNLCSASGALPRMPHMNYAARSPH